MNCVGDLLGKDQDLLFHAVHGQASSIYEEVLAYFKVRDHDKLLSILQTVSKMAAILAHVKVAHDIPNLKCETGTLAITLLPFLNHCCDYSFLQDADVPTLVVFLQSLKVHIKDSHAPYKKGFVLCTLKFNASMMQEIVLSAEH